MAGVAASGRGAEPGPSSARRHRADVATQRRLDVEPGGDHARPERQVEVGRARVVGAQPVVGGEVHAPDRLVPVDVGLGGATPAARGAEVGVADQEQVTLDHALEHRGERTPGVRRNGLGGGEAAGGRQEGGSCDSADDGASPTRRRSVQAPHTSGRSCPDPARMVSKSGGILATWSGGAPFPSGRGCRPRTTHRLIAEAAQVAGRRPRRTGAQHSQSCSTRALPVRELVACVPAPRRDHRKHGVSAPTQKLSHVGDGQAASRRAQVEESTAQIGVKWSRRGRSRCSVVRRPSGHPPCAGRRLTPEAAIRAGRHGPGGAASQPCPGVRDVGAGGDVEVDGTPTMPRAALAVVAGTSNMTMSSEWSTRTASEVADAVAAVAQRSTRSRSLLVVDRSSKLTTPASGRAHSVEVRGSAAELGRGRPTAREVGVEERHSRPSTSVDAHSPDGRVRGAGWRDARSVAGAVYEYGRRWACPRPVAGGAGAAGSGTRRAVGGRLRWR